MKEEWNVKKSDFGKADKKLSLKKTDYIRKGINLGEKTFVMGIVSNKFLCFGDTTFGDVTLEGIMELYIRYYDYLVGDIYETYL